MNRKKMPETMYRASRYFRVLGNPTAYMILRILGRGRATPSAMSEELGLTLNTVSSTLRHLREIDLVRYETQWRTKEYWIKDRAVVKMLDSGEKMVERMRAKEV